MHAFNVNTRLMDTLGTGRAIDMGTYCYHYAITCIFIN